MTGGQDQPPPHTPLTPQSQRPSPLVQESQPWTLASHQVNGQANLLSILGAQRCVFPSSPSWILVLLGGGGGLSPFCVSPSA